MDESGTVVFLLGDMVFEYDDEKNKKNIQKHGISFKNAAKVFFDYDRIEAYDVSDADEDRYDTIGSLSIGMGDTVIGNIGKFRGQNEDIVFVVYTERVRVEQDGKEVDVTRLISARMATNFERGLYYGKC